MSLKALQGRVERAMLDEQNVLGLLLNRSSNALPVLRAKNQYSQDEQIERALEERHTIVSRLLGDHSTQL
jgi:hypothetical protein